jgi:hypothetical protein
MSRRLAALTALVFAFAVVSYSGMATGQEKDKTKATAKSTAKGTKKGKDKAPAKTEKSF